jgi:primosomal protein N'
MAIYGVLLPLNFDDVFDYSYDDKLDIGQLVRVSFGKEELIGVVYKIGKSANIDIKKIKPIKEVLALPLISKKLFSFIEKTATYNLSTKGMVLKMVLGQKTNQLPKQKVLLYGLKIKNENLEGIRITEARRAVFNFLENNNCNPSIQPLVKNNNYNYPFNIEVFFKANTTVQEELHQEGNLSTLLIAFRLEEAYTNKNLIQNLIKIINS